MNESTLLQSNSPQFLSEEIGKYAAHLRYEDLPSEVVEKIKVCLLVNLSIATAGHSIVPEVRRVMEMLSIAPGKGARAFVQGTPLSAPDAAFVNSAMMHARTQDDFQHSAHSHIGTVAIPAALAICEWRGVNGRDLLTALAVAYQVATVLGNESASSATAKGFRPSGLFSMIGAGAACARLLGLNARQIANSVALSANFAAGLNQTWIAGTDEWKLHIANASRNAVTCALLAEAGHNAAPDTFEGQFGFFIAHQGAIPSTAAMSTSLRSKWSLATVGFKPLPICGINLGPADHALRLLRARQVRPEAISKIEIAMPYGEATMAGIAATGPINGVGSALMRTAYVVAVCLIRGKLQHRDLIERDDAEVLSLSERIRVVVGDGLQPMSHVMRVETLDGTSFEEHFNQSSSDFALDRAQSMKLLRGISDELPLPFSQIEKLERHIWKLDHGTPPAELVSTLQRSSE